MDVIIGIMGVLGAAAAIVFLSTVSMSGMIKAALIVVMVFLAVYGMARIPSKESKKAAAKERSQKPAPSSLRQETIGSLDRQIS